MTVERGKSRLAQARIRPRGRRWTFVVCGLLLQLACGGSKPPASTVPNVLIIVADDLGFSDVSVLGGEFPTPNIDSIANEGVLLTNFHVAATCSPTRAMLLSGVDNHRAGLGNMGEFLSDEQRGQPGYEGHLNHRVRTLANVLRDSGYATAMVGKWHLGGEPSERPHARGFDRTFAMLEGSGSAWSDRSAAPILGERTHFSRNGVDVEREPAFAATLYVDEVIDFVDQKPEGAPFFAYLAFQAVHWPHHAPAEFLEKARGRYDAGWRAVRDARLERQRQLEVFAPGTAASPIGELVPHWSELTDEQRADEAARMEAYAAMGMAMDAEIGRLLDHLRSIGELDDTLVLFVSDNGADPSAPERSPGARAWYEARYPKTAPADFGEEGSFPSTGYAWARVSVAPLATHKGAPGEGGLRVPLIARYPARIPPGTKSNALGYVTDVVPTILEAVGVATRDAQSSEQGGGQAAVDGRSLWALMTGDANEAHLDSESIGYELMGNSALFKGDFKLVREHTKDWRLYDIAHDPGETIDLSVSRPALFEELHRAYEQYEADMNVIPVPEDYDVMKQLLKASRKNL